jgi:AbiEi antitoxin C-terminal domain
MRGAPPLAAWLNDYMRVQNHRYYVGLLSAAALHGSSNHGVQVTQVILSRPRRPIAVGKIHLDFYVKSRLALTPLTEIPGLPARVRTMRRVCNLNYPSTWPPVPFRWTIAGRSDPRTMSGTAHLKLGY